MACAWSIAAAMTASARSSRVSATQSQLSSSASYISEGGISWRDTLRIGEARAVTVRREVKNGAPTWTLDSAALQTRGVATTADALRRLPSVNLRDYGGAGGLKMVSVRGLGASHTVVTHDGLPVGDARTGQIDFRRFPLHRLQSVSLAVADAPELLVPVRALGAATVQMQSKSVGKVVGLQAGSWGWCRPLRRGVCEAVVRPSELRPTITAATTIIPLS